MHRWSIIKGGVLYKEGQKADNVYLVKEGLFKVTKKIVNMGGIEN
jgi:CRP-like cAMP-binding protein